MNMHTAALAVTRSHNEILVILLLSKAYFTLPLMLLISMIDLKTCVECAVTLKALVISILQHLILQSTKFNYISHFKTVASLLTCLRLQTADNQVRIQWLFVTTIRLMMIFEGELVGLVIDVQSSETGSSC